MVSAGFSSSDKGPILRWLLLQPTQLDTVRLNTQILNVLQRRSQPFGNDTTSGRLLVIDRLTLQHPRDEALLLTRPDNFRLAISQAARRWHQSNRATLHFWTRTLFQESSLIWRECLEGVAGGFSTPSTWCWSSAPFLGAARRRNWLERNCCGDGRPRAQGHPGDPLVWWCRCYFQRKGAGSSRAPYICSSVETTQPARNKDYAMGRDVVDVARSSPDRRRSDTGCAPARTGGKVHPARGSKASVKVAVGCPRGSVSKQSPGGYQYRWKQRNWCQQRRLRRANAASGQSGHCSTYKHIRALLLYAQRGREREHGRKGDHHLQIKQLFLLRSLAKAAVVVGCFKLSFPAYQPSLLITSP